MKGKVLVVLGVFVGCCSFWLVQAAVTCTAAGRFADTADTTCQNYTLCVYVSSNDSYIGYEYTCPTTSVFNPNTAQCTASDNYTCNTTSSVCTGDGYVADPDSTNCTGYIECVDNGDGTYTETSYTCPDNTYFNPNTTNCESDYNCTTTSTTFTCTAAGRFADESDTTCKAYFLCVLDSSTSTYLQYDYNCTTTAVFNPNSKVCTTSYTCPTA